MTTQAARISLWLVLVSLLGCNYFQNEPKANPESPLAESPVPQTPAISPLPSGMATEPNPDIPTPGERIEIALATSITTDRCVVRWISFVSGRPAVLQLSSYASQATEQFPSIYLRAIIGTEQTTKAESLEELVGEEFEAALFIQREAGGPLWCSDASAPILLHVVQASGARVECEFVGGTLVNLTTGEAEEVAGHFSGAFR